jgi:predicted nuclease with RNAse H fold
MVHLCGVDLAAKEDRPTGFALLDGDMITLKLLFPDREMMEEARFCDYVAVDAPTSGKDSFKERYLRRLGAFPVSMRWMRILTERAVRLFPFHAGRFFESFPTGCLKQLGMYDPGRRAFSSFIHREFEIEGRINRHTLDAAAMALTLRLFLLGEGFVIPEGGLPLVLPARFKLGTGP